MRDAPTRQEDGSAGDRGGSVGRGGRVADGLGVVGGVRPCGVLEGGWRGGEGGGRRERGRSREVREAWGLDESLRGKGKAKDGKGPFSEVGGGQGKVGVIRGQAVSDKEATSDRKGRGGDGGGRAVRGEQDAKELGKGPSGAAAGAGDLFGHGCGRLDWGAQREGHEQGGSASRAFEGKENRLVQRDASVVGARAKSRAGTPKGGRGGAAGPPVADPVATRQVGGPPQQEASAPAEVRPFNPPQLHRHVLASRAVALQQRVEGIEAKDPQHPKLEAAKEALGSTRRMVREAGGATPQKLCFSLLDAHGRIEKCRKETVQAEANLRAATEDVKDAVAKQVKAEEHVAASKLRQKYANERLAYLGFQAAVEGGQHITGYGGLAEALAYFEADVLSRRGKGGSSTQAEHYLEQMGKFIRQFAPVHYEAVDDPVLQQVASSHGSDATKPLGSQASDVTIVVDWKEQEAQAEEAAVQQDNKAGGGRKRRHEDGGEAEDALEKVRVAAASAVVHRQLADARQELDKEAIGAGQLPLAWSSLASAAKIPVPLTSPCGLLVVRGPRDASMQGSGSGASGRSRSKERRLERAGAAGALVA